MQHIELKKKIWEQLCQLWLCHADLIPPAQEAERTHKATHPPPSSGEHKAPIKSCTPRSQAGGEARPQVNETWF